MPDLDFGYDETFYPNDDQLPDPQINPVLPGAKVKIQKVGIAPVDLPIKLMRRDGTVQELHAKASLYGSLDDPDVRDQINEEFRQMTYEGHVFEQLSMFTKSQLDALKSAVRMEEERRYGATQETDTY